MFKLIRYEFRKSWTALSILLGALAALELYFLGALAADRGDHIGISIALLALCVYGMALFVFIRGVTSYSGELKNRSGYLLFMTPNPAIKIMGSKFLYTFVNGLLLAALAGTLAAIDVGLLLRHYGELDEFLAGLRLTLTMSGIYVDRVLWGVAFLAAYAFLTTLSTVGVAYLAITLSHTLFRDKRWRWLPSLAIFAGLTWLTNAIANRLTPPTEDIFALEYGGTLGIRSAAYAMDELVPALTPAALLSLAVIALSLIGCSALLEKKVSL